MENMSRSAVETVRRVRELMAGGFTIEQIAGAAGRPVDVLVALMTPLQWISPATADAIEAAEQKLLATRGAQ
jgi:hypothetical protein